MFPFYLVCGPFRRVTRDIFLGFSPIQGKRFQASPVGEERTNLLYSVDLQVLFGTWSSEALRDFGLEKSSKP